MSTQPSYSVVASSLHSDSVVREAIRPVRRALENAGASSQRPSASEPHVYLVATGGTEQLLLDQIRDRHDQAPFEPAVVVAHGSHNALPAALETVARLHQTGRRARVLFVADAAGTETADALAEALADLDAIHRFHACRLGLVGTPSEWLVASTPTASTVAARWGPTLIDVKMPRVLDGARSVPVSLGRTVSSRFSGRPRPADLPAPADIDAAAHLHPVLEHVSADHRLDAITVRCFDFLTELQTSGCVALAQLNDDGFVAGCEGDVPATLALLWARYLLGRPGWIANPSSVDVSKNQIELAHCTVAPSMVEDFSLSTHFESGIGVGIHGHFEPGPVTLIRIGGAELDRVWLADGHIVASGASVELCRTQATVHLDDRHVNDLLERPLGNHVVLVAGHHARRLMRWWGLAIADPTRQRSADSVEASTVSTM